MKECRECGELKEPTDFRTTVTHGKEYLRSQCKQCQNQIRNLQHRQPKYKMWQAKRCKKQYQNKKSPQPTSKRGQLSGISLTIHEAHELHTALGEKLKEINENNN